MPEILDLLWTFRSVQQRMILRDSLLTRQAGSVSTLSSLSRDAVLLILSTNNTQERLVAPLVDRLGTELGLEENKDKKEGKPGLLKTLLNNSYSGGQMTVYQSFGFIINISGRQG